MSTTWRPSSNWPARDVDSHRYPGTGHWSATRGAEPAAVDTVFAATPGPYRPYRGCDTGEFDTSGCLYRDRSTNNTIQFDMERRDQVCVVTGPSSARPDHPSATSLPPRMFRKITGNARNLKKFGRHLR